MVTRKVVADYAKVSTATVSYVLNNKRYVNEELRRRVLEAVEILNYHPNIYAQNLAGKRSNVIALLVDELINPYYMEITELIDYYVREKGFYTDVFTVHDYNMTNIIDELIIKRMDGIINLTLFGIDEKQFNLLQNSNIKLTNFGEGACGSTVYIDYESALREYMKWLSENGYKSLAFIAGFGAENGRDDRRIKTYLENIKDLHFNVDKRLLVYGDYPRRKSYENGYEGIKYLFENSVKFDSIFCINDMTAIGALRALADFNIKVPDDVSMLSCDNIKISEYMCPRLSTIDVSKDAMCKIYVDDIITRINDEKTVTNVYTINTKLILRDTTK